MNRKRSWALIVLLFHILICFTGCSGKQDDLDVPHNSKNTSYIRAEVMDVYNGKRGIVTIVSDDGHYDSGVLLNELLSKYNIKGTVAGAVSIVNPHLEDWKTIISEGNIDLVSHSYSHYRMEDGSEISYNIDALYHELIDADTYYEKNFGTPQIAFVCPENQLCKAGEYILENNGFYAARRGIRGYNTLNPQEGVKPGEWFNLEIQGILDEGTSTDVRNEWVDFASENQTWLIEMWHNVAFSDDGHYQTLLYDEAEEHISYMSQKEDIWVASYTEVVKYLREKQNSILTSEKKDDDSFTVTTQLNNDLSPEVFDHLLTLKVYLPEEWNDESNVYCDEVLYDIDGELGSRYIIINVLPDSTVTIKRWK